MRLIGEPARAGNLGPAGAVPPCCDGPADTDDIGELLGTRSDGGSEPPQQLALVQFEAGSEASYREHRVAAQPLHSLFHYRVG